MIKQVINIIIGLVITIGITGTGGVMYIAFKLNEWMNGEKE
jgi:hypothetical protein